MHSQSYRHGRAQLLKSFFLTRQVKRIRELKYFDKEYKNEIKHSLCKTKKNGILI